MSDLHIRDLPEPLLRCLEERAAAHGRSASAEARAILEAALRPPPAPLEPPTLEEIDRLRVHGKRPLTQELIDRSRRGGRP